MHDDDHDYHSFTDDDDGLDADDDGENLDEKEEVNSHTDHRSCS